MTHVVIDSNVLAVSNGIAPQADDDCVATCIARLLSARDCELVVLDVAGLILEEYHRHCNPWNPQGVADQFLLWLLQAQGDTESCERVELAETGDERRPFAAFPNDADLARFDLNDHKYVAVAISSVGEPTVINAVDSDWRDFRGPLERHGVVVECLCPGCLSRHR